MKRSAREIGAVPAAADRLEHAYDRVQLVGLGLDQRQFGGQQRALGVELFEIGRIAGLIAVARVLESDWLTQGPAIPAFEAALAQRAQAKHAVAVTNATAALHIACLAAGLGPGDRLWTTPNTFVASANCARYCGADVDFVIGSADGLARSVKSNADVVLALSALTLPHGLARVLLVEQLYRAHSLLTGHPYHRA